MAVFKLITENNLEQIRNLVHKEGAALLDTRDSRGRTPLMCAIKEGRQDIFDFLLAIAQAADVNATDGAPNRIVSYASLQGRYYMDKIFEQFGPQLDKKSLAIALGYYAALGDAFKVNACLLYGADVNESGYDDPPLMLALRGNHAEVATILLGKSDLDVNRENRFKESALITAIMHAPTMVDALLAKQGIAILQKSYFFSTPLTAAVFKGNLPLAEALIKLENENYGGIDVMRHPGLIGWLIKRHQYELLQKILDAQIDISKVNYSAGLDDPEIVGMEDWLAKEQMYYAETVNSYAWSSDSFELPSIIAVQQRSIEAICLLMKAGVDFAQKNESGLSAYDYDDATLIREAQDRQDQVLFKQMVACLNGGDFGGFTRNFSKLFDKTVQDEQGMTLLHYLLVTPNTQQLIDLALTELDPNTCDRRGDTALLSALRKPYCWSDNIRTLCQANNLDLTIQNAEGNNPLHLAIINKHLAVLHLLQTHENDHLVRQGERGDGKTAVELATQDALLLKLLDWSRASGMQVEQITELFEDCLFLPLSKLNEQEKILCSVLIATTNVSYVFCMERIGSNGLSLNEGQMGAAKILFSLLKQRSTSSYYGVIKQLEKIGSLSEQDILLFYEQLAANFARILVENVDEKAVQYKVGTLTTQLSPNFKQESNFQELAIQTFIDQLSESAKKMHDLGNERSFFYHLVIRAGLYQQNNDRIAAEKDIKAIYDLYTKLMHGTQSPVQQLSYTLNCLLFYPQDQNTMIKYALLIDRINNKNLFAKAIERIEHYLVQAFPEQKDVKLNELLQKLKFKHNKHVSAAPAPTPQLGKAAVTN